MTFVTKLGVVLAVLGFDAAVAQEGYLGRDHDKWHHGFYKTLERPDTKSPCCNLTDCRPTSGRQVVKIDDQLEPSRLLHRQIAGFCAAQELGELPAHGVSPQGNNQRPIADQPTLLCHLRPLVHRRQP
jgi:hypothetical protein